MREFLFNYRFGGHEWGITIYADSPDEAKEKIRAVALARYEGEMYMRIPASMSLFGLLPRRLTADNEQIRVLLRDVSATTRPSQQFMRELATVLLTEGRISPNTARMMLGLIPIDEATMKIEEP